MSNRHCLSPLNRAIFDNKIEIMMLLIEHGADVDMVDGKHWTPLNMAIEVENLKILEILLQNGAHVNMKRNKSYSPLNTAITNDKLKIVSFLIKHGADVNMVDGVMWSPITKTIDIGNLQILKTLLQNGANPNPNTLIDKHHYSPLNRAIFADKSEIYIIIGVRAKSASFGYSRLFANFGGFAGPIAT